MRSAIIILTVLAVVAPAIAQTKPISAAGALPDVYPSRRAAAAAIADQIGLLLSDEKDTTASSRILVATGPESLNADDLRVLEDLATNLRRAFPKAEFAGSLLAQRAVSDGLVVRVSVTHDAGVIEAQAQLPDRAPVIARFVDKLWADDWTAFVNADSNHRWLRGDSPRTAISQDEAQEKACADAANKLLSLVKTQMNINAAGRASIRVADTFIASHTKELLVNGTAVADTFVQRYARPYGDVWKASVLIDASPGKIDTIARAVSDQARASYNQKQAADKQQAIQQARTWGSLAALMAVIVVLYWFLNAATKGYFTWRLRFGAVMLIVLGVLAALFIGLLNLRMEHSVVRTTIQSDR